MDTAAYHTQQCVEKSLKAYLAFKNQHIPYTHDLQRLLRLCSQYDRTFEIFFNDTLDLLPYATYSRYPDDWFSIDSEEIIKAIKKAKTIFDFVKKKIETLSFQLIGDPKDSK